MLVGKSQSARCIAAAVKMSSSGVVVGILVAVVACAVLFVIPNPEDPRIIKLQSRIKYITSTVTSLFLPQVKDDGKLFTPEELRAYDGSDGSPGLYLAIMGKVFDVKKGKKHYGPGGGYSFFAARDGSKAYVAGDFTEEGLTPEVSSLTPKDMLGLEGWLEFFHKEYTYLGKLSGHFYDETGEPTANLRAAQEAIQQGKREKEGEEEERKRFPPCNSEWKQATGQRVWCTNLSGGIKREWVGVPRKLFNPGTNKWRCACIQEDQLNNPHLRLYDNCDPSATSCKVDA